MAIRQNIFGALRPRKRQQQLTATSYNVPQSVLGGRRGTDVRRKPAHHLRAARLALLVLLLARAAAWKWPGSLPSLQL